MTIQYVTIKIIKKILKKKSKHYTIKMLCMKYFFSSFLINLRYNQNVIK